VLKFSTSKDGFALNSLMRKLAKVEGPVVLIMSDLPGAVFGAFLSDAPKFSEHFQGTGETFLFTLKPDYDVITFFKLKSANVHYSVIIGHDYNLHMNDFIYC
jgi:hypothetical protein